MGELKKQLKENKKFTKVLIAIASLCILVIIVPILGDVITALSSRVNKAVNKETHHLVTQEVEETESITEEITETVTEAITEDNRPKVDIFKSVKFKTIQGERFGDIKVPVQLNNTDEDYIDIVLIISQINDNEVGVYNDNVQFKFSGDYSEYEDEYPIENGYIVLPAGTKVTYKVTEESNYKQVNFYPSEKQYTVQGNKYIESINQVDENKLKKNIKNAYSLINNYDSSASNIEYLGYYFVYPMDTTSENENYLVMIFKYNTKNWNKYITVYRAVILDDPYVSGKDILTNNEDDDVYGYLSNYYEESLVSVIKEDVALSNYNFVSKQNILKKGKKDYYKN